MMNKQKTSKAWSWKVATFLPLLALLLMAFGKPGENVSPESQSNKTILDQKKMTTHEPATKASSNQEKTTTKHPTTQSKEEVYIVVEVMPEFPGGEKALVKFMNDNVHYPEEAKGIQGKVYVNFIVNSEGKVVNAKVIKSASPFFNDEALRMLRSMPQWTPGKQKGEPVSVSYTKVIYFVPSPGSSDKPKTDIAPPPSPIKDKFFIYLRKDGKFRCNANETQINENELAEKVKSELQGNPKLQFVVLIEEGKIDERVNQIKDILNINGNPKVSFSSLHTEKGKNGNSSVMYTKPMNIK